MSWLDEARRSEFEKNERVLVAGSGNLPAPSELDGILPKEVQMRALTIGCEHILCYEDAEDALTAIRVATEHNIAVLGFDTGEIIAGKFQVVDHSGYDGSIPVPADWKSYVAVMNREAQRWIEGHPLGHNHGYILSSTSHKEFSNLQK